jgi:hypothetical protein
MGDTTRTCTGCQRTLPETGEFFYGHKGGPGGMRTMCKQCVLDRKRSQYRESRGIPADSPVRMWRKSEPVVDGMRRCLDCQELLPNTAEFFFRQTRGFKPYCKKCHVARNFSNVTKMSYAERDEALARQGGGCAICGTTEPGDKGWHIDHDHECCDDDRRCGKCTRGILCSMCNWGLGAFRDDIGSLMNAVDYLKEWQAR